MTKKMRDDDLEKVTGGVDIAEDSSHGGSPGRNTIQPEPPADDPATGSPGGGGGPGTVTVEQNPPRDL